MAPAHRPRPGRLGRAGGGGATPCDRAAVAATCARRRSSSARSSLVRSPVGAGDGSTGSSVVSPARGSGTGVGSGSASGTGVGSASAVASVAGSVSGAVARRRFGLGVGPVGVLLMVVLVRWSGAAPGRRRSGRPTAGTASVPTGREVRMVARHPARVSGESAGQAGARGNPVPEARALVVGGPGSARRAGRPLPPVVPQPPGCRCRLGRDQPGRRVRAGGVGAQCAGRRAAAKRGSEESRPGVPAQPGCAACTETPRSAHRWVSTGSSSTCPRLLRAYATVPL